jgi:replication initiation and membrane attachment protein
MRINQLHHFTEHHRFCVHREFALSTLQQKMLTAMYQPMIGPLAVSLYQTLHAQLAPDRTGFSAMEQQRKLFMAMQMAPNEKGRTLLLEQTSMLEAVGLMQSYRKYLPQTDDYVFEYRLQAPLGPQEFFENAHLTLLLRDRIGKYMLLLLRDELVTDQPEELADPAISSEALSVPFYELFELNTKVVDLELEQLSTGGGLREPAKVNGAIRQEEEGIRYEQIMSRFPRVSVNRLFVEHLRNQPQQMATIRFVAKKFRLSAAEVCRLLDEDGVFDDDGELQLERVQYVANLMFRQSKRRDEQRERQLHKAPQVATNEQSNEPSVPKEQSVQMQFYLDVPALFHGQCDVHQYNLLLRNQSYTQVLQLFFQQRAVPDPLLDVFSKLDLTYKLPDQVLNVLIHYLHVLNKSWTKGFIESIASDISARNISTYEQAVEYVRTQIAARQAPKASGNGATTTNRTSTSQKGRKPKLIAQYEQPIEQQQLTPEELEELKRMAAELDQPKPGANPHR